MKDQVKIVFFDIDNTLYDSNTNQVPISTIKSLKLLKANNVKIAIATGRPYMMLKDLKELINEVNFDYIITSNGQCIHKDNECIYQNYLDENDVKKIIHYALHNDFALSLISNEFSICNKHNQAMIDAAFYTKVALPMIVDFNQFNHHKIQHAVCYENTYNNDVELHKTTITTWNELAFEFVCDNGLKAHGIEIVLKREELSSCQAMAFGDGHNDIEMIKYVKYGFAMGNSHPQLLEHAFYVCANINDDGIYNALKNYNII